MRTLLGALFLLVCAIGAGCGGGGGDPAYDLNGWWLYALPGTGGVGEPPVVAAGPAWHRGSDVVLLGLHLVLEGTSLVGADPDFESASRSEYHLTVRSQDRIEGTIHAYPSGAPTDVTDVVLLRSPPPSGVLTMEGTADGGPIHLGSSTSYAFRQRAPAAGGGTDNEVQVLDMMPDGQNGIGFSLWFPDVWLPPRVMSVPADLRAGVIVDQQPYEATAGTITLTRLDADRVQGEYVLVLGLHGSAEGTFDVPILRTSDL